MLILLEISTKCAYKEIKLGGLVGGVYPRNNNDGKKVVTIEVMSQGMRKICY